MDRKIARFDGDLRKYRDAMKSMRPGPSLEQIKKRALGVMKQKKMLEGQRDKIMDNVMRLDETRYTTSAMQDQAEMVKALKAASKEMKVQMKKTKELDVDHVHDIMDELQDQRDQFEELQMAMSSYDVPVDIDDAELMAEMDLLGEEVAEEAETEGTPAYMMDIPDAPMGRVREEEEGLEGEEASAQRVAL